MSSKRQKVSKKGSTSEDNRFKFVNLKAAKRFVTLLRNKTFFKEKGIQHLENFFMKTIAYKGWKALCQSLKPDATMIVKEFYANLSEQVLKKVRVRGVLANFSAETINKFYNLEPSVEDEYQKLVESLDYAKVIRVFTNGQGEWKTSNEGYAMHSKAKHLGYIPKVWHHFITSRLMPTTNVCDVIAKRALLNYAILQDKKFDVGKIIEDAIRANKEGRINLRHPFLIYQLCR